MYYIELYFLVRAGWHNRTASKHVWGDFWFGFVFGFSVPGYSLARLVWACHLVSPWKCVSRQWYKKRCLAAPVLAGGAGINLSAWPISWDSAGIVRFMEPRMPECLTGYAPKHLTEWCSLWQHLSLSLSLPCMPFMVGPLQNPAILNTSWLSQSLLMPIKLRNPGISVWIADRLYGEYLRDSVNPESVFYIHIFPWPLNSFPRIPPSWGR